MRNHDLTPLWRSTIGFDRPLNLIDDSMGQIGEDRYRISLALAGFAPQEITITAKQNVLTIEGRTAEQGDRDYLYQGISASPFRRVFNLADYVRVEGASFESGLLKIDLVREVPEEAKPRRIPIGTSGAGRKIEHKSAA